MFWIAIAILFVAFPVQMVRLTVGFGLAAVLLFFGLFGLSWFGLGPLS